MLIKVSDSKAYRVTLMRFKHEKGEKKNPVMLSIRQLYKTKKDPEWKIGRQGVTFDFDDCKRIIKGIIKVFKSDEVEVVEPYKKGGKDD